MSRVIKFRAWDKSDNKMQKVHSIHLNTGKIIVTYKGGGNMSLNKDEYELMQFTGLYDKNGKEIYEGDILNGFQYPFLSDGNHNYIAEVLWIDKDASFGICIHKAIGSRVSGISAGFIDLMEDWNPDDWEIIGNIYENPDLLGEEYGREENN